MYVNSAVMAAATLTDSPRAQFMLSKLRRCSCLDEREITCVYVPAPAPANVHVPVNVPAGTFTNACTNTNEDVSITVDIPPITVYCARIDDETIVVTGIPARGAPAHDWRMYATAKDAGRTHVHGAIIDAIEWAPGGVLLHAGSMTWFGKM